MHHIIGVGWSTISLLVKMGWQGSGIAEQMLDKLKAKPATAIRKKWSANYINEVQEHLRNKQIETMTIWDADYPPLLRELPQPPWVLYLRGNRELLNSKCIAVVGTRKASSYGRKVTEQLSSQLAAAGWTVVSGMAAGIDGYAHQSVLATRGNTIAVLGTGIDEIFPKHHRQLYERLIKDGLVISEYPPGTPGHPGLFPQRNRIISGLSFGTVVVEAAERSGSLITAEFCLEQGREVFAVPGPITSQGSRGTLSLIQQGAKCIQTVEDILEELPNWRTEPYTTSYEEVAVSLTSTESLVLAYIGTEPQQITALMEQMSEEITISDLHVSLLSLELKGCITQLPGAHYIKRY